MNKHEKELLREAIRLLNGIESGECEWEPAMEILCHLAGLRVAPIPKMRSVNVLSIMNSANTNTFMSNSTSSDNDKLEDDKNVASN